MRRPNAIFRALANQVCANAFMDTGMYKPISIRDAIRQCVDRKTKRVVVHCHN
jgi:hypothetical protein